MTPTDEIIVLQHRLTEQTMLVPVSIYLAGARGKFRNFRLKGTGKFIAPPDIILPSAPISPQPEASPSQESISQ
jgi:hypothetical protein